MLPLRRRSPHGTALHRQPPHVAGEGRGGGEGGDLPRLPPPSPFRVSFLSCFCFGLLHVLIWSQKTEKAKWPCPPCFIVTPALSLLLLPPLSVAPSPVVFGRSGTFSAPPSLPPSLSILSFLLPAHPPPPTYPSIHPARAPQHDRSNGVYRSVGGRPPNAQRGRLPCSG